MNKELNQAVKILAEYIAQESLEITLHFYNNDKADLAEEGITKKQYLLDGEENQDFYIENEITLLISKASEKAYKRLVALECKKK